MPKKVSSLRPITNLGSAASLSQAHFRLSGLGQQELKPVNAQLMDLFSILKFEKVCELQLKNVFEVIFFPENILRCFFSLAVSEREK